MLNPASANFKAFKLKTSNRFASFRKGKSSKRNLPSWFTTARGTKKRKKNRPSLGVGENNKINKLTRFKMARVTVEHKIKLYAIYFIIISSLNVSEIPGRP